MCSLTRTQRRRRGLPHPTGRRIVETTADGGYRVLHPTKGWRAFGLRRTRAFQMQDALKRLAGSNPQLWIETIARREAA